MNQAQNENTAQNVNADGVNEVEQMKVVPPHLNPVQQGAIIAALQHQLPQMRVEINRNRNQHLLGVEDQNVPWEPVAEEQLEEITEHERRRIEGLQRIMRTAPKFHTRSQEP